MTDRAGREAGPSLRLARPDDWHIHLRDDGALATTVPHAGRYLGRVLVMPNLRPPVTTIEAALDYRRRILAALPDGSALTPLMTLYLTDRTSPEEIAAARTSGLCPAAKLYPAGATTHSEAGVKTIEALDDCFAAMEEQGLVLSIHGEITDPASDVFDRERLFVERHLAGIVRRFPRLRIVLEHITTRAAVDFVRSARDGVAATITAHHLLYNRNALFTGGIRPHYYCLPLLKRETDRRALVEAACSGDPRFFYGSDSAPHPRTRKEAACGCAGIYTAHAGIELCAEAFDEAGRLDRLEGFCAHHGADFYDQPRSQETVRLVRDDWRVDEHFDYDGGTLVPLRAGERIGWRIDDGEAAT